MIKNCICGKEFEVNQDYIKARNELAERINSQCVAMEDCLCINCIKQMVEEIEEENKNIEKYQEVLKSNMNIKVGADGNNYILYKNTPCWRLDGTIESFKEYKFQIVAPDHEGLTFYTIMCIDNYDDQYHYGEFDSLDEVKEWLDNPKDMI